MPISEYLKSLRSHVGHGLLLVPGVLAIVRNADDHILMMRRSDDNTWGLPAGALDPGEAPAQGLVREVWEETGLVVEPVRLAGLFGGPKFRFEYPNGDVTEYMIAVFDCRVVRGALEARDGEALELRYWPPDAMPPQRSPIPGELFQPHAASDPPIFQWEAGWAADSV